jgi:hypothetical protein
MYAEPRDMWNHIHVVIHCRLVGVDHDIGRRPHNLKLGEWQDVALLGLGLLATLDTTLYS